MTKYWWVNQNKFTRHGIGKFTNKSGNKISGFWVDDTSVNFSTSIDAQGFQWYGSLRNLKPHTLNIYEVIDADSEYSQWLSRNDQWVLQKT